jgi:hypothetical protein
VPRDAIYSRNSIGIGWPLIRVGRTLEVDVTIRDETRGKALARTIAVHFGDDGNIAVVSAKAPRPGGPSGVHPAEVGVPPDGRR